MNQPQDQPHESYADEEIQGIQQVAQNEKILSPIRNLLFRGGSVEICDKLSWLYFNSAIMQHAVFQMEWAFEHDVARMAENGVVYPGDSLTNAELTRPEAQ